MTRLILASSTTSTARSVSGGAGSGTTSAGSASGSTSRNPKADPTPGVLSTQTEPPISATNWRVIARPSPVPSYLRFASLST